MEAQDDQENDGKGPSSSSSKLKVKLKISKLMKDEDEVNVVVGKDEDSLMEDEKNICEEKKLVVKNKKEHICSECAKEFSSGKALGGHMSSAHVQANQRLEESWKKKNCTQGTSLMRRFEEEDIGDGIFHNHDMKITCDLCGKNFPSKKSLFGHMRCHPDRDWRGMKPPKKNAENGGFPANFHDEDEDGDDVIRGGGEEDEEERGMDVDVAVPPPLTVDLKGCLKGWGVTDRRGRSPLAKKRSVSSTTSDDKELHDAVYQLMRLVNGDNNNNHNNNSEVLCSSNSVGSAPKETPFNNLKNKSKRNTIVYNTEEETCTDSPVQKKRRPEKRLNKLEPGKHTVLSPKKPEVKYNCNICGKIFSSHQALGGHRSSHNKFKIIIENTMDHQDQEIKARNQEDHNHQDVQLGDQGINNYNIIEHGSNNNNVGKCKICDEIFPTGQALGGHPRSHWTNNQDEPSTQNASKVLVFDLNELPELDDDDDEYYR